MLLDIGVNFEFTNNYIIFMQQFLNACKIWEKVCGIKKIKMSAPLIQIESTHDDNNRHQRQYEQPPRRKRVHLYPLVSDCLIVAVEPAAWGRETAVA